MGCGKTAAFALCKLFSIKVLSAAFQDKDIYIYRAWVFEDLLSCAYFEQWKEFFLSFKSVKHFSLGLAIV